jgi:hypothetical protein
MEDISGCGILNGRDHVGDFDVDERKASIYL